LFTTLFAEKNKIEMLRAGGVGGRDENVEMNSFVLRCSKMSRFRHLMSKYDTLESLSIRYEIPVSIITLKYHYASSSKHKVPKQQQYECM
jgi:hypothetical protein